MILFPNQMYSVYGKHVKLPEAAGIHWIGRGITCVSLKSLTPTQYTMAPRVLAVSACCKKSKQGMDRLHLEYWSAETQNTATKEIECEVATCC